MSSNVEDDHIIFPQKFYSGNSLFVYDYGDNNVANLIHTTPYISDILEFYMPNEDVVGTVVDDILESMERKNIKICDDSHYRCGKEH